jgi:serine/threonine-protein kinase HipA
MASKDSQKDIYVYSNWQEFTDPELMGTLHVINSRGKEIFSFEYDKKCLMPLKVIDARLF